MILPLLLALAGAGSAPRAIHAEDWLTDADYPIAALTAGRSGRVVVGLTVSPEGRPMRCETVRSSGWAQLDERACTVLMKRARFGPAHDEGGAPVASMVMRQVTWAVSQPVAMAVPADLLLSVKGMPKDSTARAVAVRQVIGADGKIESCAIDTSSNVPSLDRVACAQAVEIAKEGPARDAGGAPVRTLRLVRILFSPAW